jgi:hypothetical protein
MAKIGTYPVVTPTADDKLIGTNGADSVTKNFLVGAVGDLAIGGHVATADPHVQYLTVARAALLYAPLAVPYSSLTDVPLTFAPTAHASTHAVIGSDPLTLAQSQITNLTSDLAAKQDVSSAFTLDMADLRYYQLSTDLATQAELDTHTALTIAAHGGIVADTDARLSDARVPLAHNQAWLTITATPTTLAGYGITDSFTQALADARYSVLAHVHAFSTLTSIPTTLAGYGITDAYTKTASDARFAPIAVVGSVTSVALAVSGVLHSVTGSPITTSGTITLGLLTQTANTVLAGPASGSAATPTMRALVAADLPNPLNALGIRTAIGSSAAGLYVPWITGDALTTLVVGSPTVGNNQIAVLGYSDTSVAIYGISANAVAGRFDSANATSVVASRAPASASAFPITAINIVVNPASAGVVGTGGAILFTTKSDTTGSRNQAQIASLWTDPADATRTSALIFQTTNSGTIAERMRLTGAGALLLRSTDATQANGLYVPWVTGDALPTMRVGSSSGSNNQIAIQGDSGSAIALYGLSQSAAGVRGESGSSIGILAQTNSGTLPAFDALVNAATATATITPTIRIRTRSSGVPAAGFGAQFLWQLKSSTTIDQDAAQIAALWTDPTHATRTAALTFSTVANAAALAEIGRFASTGLVMAAGYSARATYFGDQADTVAYVQTATDTTHAWTLINRTATKAALSVRGAAAQSANLQEWQDSGSVVQAAIDTGTSPTATGLLLLFNSTLRRVEVGAADSGGAGYRMLRVLN